MKKIIFLFLIYTPGIFAGVVDSVALRYSKTISSDDLRKHLSVIASDAYEGRETGTRGQKMAASYIANHFKAIGIPPYKDTTYYQVYPLKLQAPAGAVITNNGKEFEFKKDFYFLPGFNDIKSDAKEIVFGGYGISDKSYDNYKDIDLREKVVIILAGEPVKKDGTYLLSNSEKPSPWSTGKRLKSQIAHDKGCKVLIIVVDSIEKDIEKNRHLIETPTLKLDSEKKVEKSEEKIPVFYISRPMAEELLGKKIEKLRSSIGEDGGFKPYVKKTALSINVERTTQYITAENVLGFVEGTDLKNEIIVITAHYDHLGIHNGVVFNGADDDGSGTVAVLELAEAFMKAKKEGKGPRRSMLFMTVSGEEKGLLGSSYYTDHPVYPLENTVADLNIDMIGRVDEKHKDNPDYIYLIGSDKLSSELHSISEDANKTYSGLELDYTYNDVNDKNRFYYRSDHYNFAKNNIPVIFYFNGVHKDYHEETDEVDKIDFKKMEKITRLVFFTAWELANRTARIKVDSNKK